MSTIIAIAIIIAIIYAIVKFIMWIGNEMHKKTSAEKKKKELLEKTRILLEKAEQGDAQAQLDIFYIYANENKSVEALEFLEKSVDSGYVEAQVLLGKKLLSGSGIEKNPTRAIDLFKKAIEQDSADGHYQLAKCYETGEGIQKDLEQSKHHMKLAADKGHEKAQGQLMTAIDFYNRGLKNMNEGKFSEALDDFNKAYFKDMSNINNVGYLAKLNCGIACYNLGDYGTGIGPGAYSHWDSVFNSSMASSELRNKAKELMEKMHREGKHPFGPRRM